MGSWEWQILNVSTTPSAWLAPVHCFKMLLEPLIPNWDRSVYSIHSRFRHRAIKANMSDASSITLAVGFPAPWPALVSTWMSSGLVCLGLGLTTYCSVAINFREWRGTTRSSWSAVSSKVAGYWTPSPCGNLILWSGEYLQEGHAFVSYLKTKTIFFLNQPLSRSSWTEKWIKKSNNTILCISKK